MPFGWRFSTLQILVGFETFPQFIEEYGNLDSQQRVTKTYQAVLDRDPDPEGLEYWSHLLGAGLGIESLVFGLDGMIQTQSATSVAAPLVAAQAAILLSANQGINPEYVARSIVNTSIDIIGLNEFVPPEDNMTDDAMHGNEFSQAEGITLVNTIGINEFSQSQWIA